MKAPDFWRSHYVVRGDATEIARHLQRSAFTSAGERLELASFGADPTAPSVLLSPGSGGHAYVFAELGYAMHRRGYNVFLMPKHGGRTVDALVARHRDALDAVAQRVGARVGVYGEGLGGYLAFYAALAHAPMASLVCQNSPAILTERAYRDALLHDTGPWTGAAQRRRVLLPLAQRLVRVVPGLKIPVSSYLDWRALIDPRSDAHAVERRLVEDGYLRDPDFDRWYPLAAVTSLVTTPPPNPLTALRTPTMFVVARDGPTPGYIVELFERLPVSRKQLVRVEGSVYWMISHPHEAAELICGWFDQTV